MTLAKLPSDVQKLLRSSSVIPNYASAILELVYNSLDADATSIAIRVDLIQHKIQVIDNGLGIAYKDMEMVGEHYVSSKHHKDALSGADPRLYGFRGEALANLISLSETVVVASRSSRSQCTHAKIFSKGELTELIATKVRPSHGTTITIGGFMYNIKVRRECIKRAAELQNVLNCIRNISLLHYSVSFSLRDDNENLVLLKRQICSSLTQSINFLFGDGLADDMERINAVKRSVRIEAYISRHLKPTKKFQFVYVNRRVLVNSKVHKYINGLLEKTMSGATSRRISKYRGAYCLPNDNKLARNDYAQKVGYPAYIIKISCPNRSCDISYLPNRTLIEFTRWNIILKGINKIIDLFNKGDSKGNLETALEGNRDDPIMISDDKPVTSRVIEIVRKVLGKDTNKFGPSQVDHAVQGIPARRIPKRTHLDNAPLDYKTEEIAREIKGIKDKINKNTKPKKSNSIDFRRFVSTIETLKLETVPAKRSYPLLRETPYINSEDSTTENILNANNFETDSSIIRRKYCEFSQRANELVEKFQEERKMIIGKPLILKHNVKKGVFRKSTLTNQPTKITNMRNKSQKLIINQYQLKKNNASELGKDYRLISHRRLQMSKGQKKNITLSKTGDHAISRNMLYVHPKIKKFNNDRALLSTYDLVKPIIKNKTDSIVERKLHRTPMPFKVESYSRYVTYDSHKNGVNQINKIGTKKHMNFAFMNNNRRSSWLPFQVQQCIEYNSESRKILRNKIISVVNTEKIDHINSSFTDKQIEYEKAIKTFKNPLKTIDDCISISIQAKEPILDGANNDLAEINQDVDTIIKSFRVSTKKQRTQPKIFYTDEAKCYADDFALSETHHNHMMNDRPLEKYINNGPDIDNVYHLANNESTHPNSPISSIMEAQIDFNNENLRSLEGNLKRFSIDAPTTKIICKKKSPFNTSLYIDVNSEFTNRIDSNLKPIQANDNQNINDDNKFKSPQENLYKDQNMFPYPRNDFNNNEDLSDDYLLFSQKSVTSKIADAPEVRQVVLSGGNNFNEESDDIMSPNQLAHLNNEQSDNNDNDWMEPEVNNLKMGFSITEKDKFMDLTEKPIKIDEKTKATEKDTTFGEVKNTTNFQVVQRLNFVPKGLSPILEGYHERRAENKNASVENDESDYFNLSIYEAFVNDIEKYANIYQDGALNIDGRCTNDLDKAKRRSDRKVSTLTFNAQGLESATVINQLDNKFIVGIMNGCRNGTATDMLVLFDQHAVHERIRLEMLMHDYKIGDSWKTCAKQGFELPLGQTELDLMSNYCEVFDRVGLKWRGFDGPEHRKILVTSVPQCVQNKVGNDLSQLKNLIGGLITELSDAILWEDFTGASNPAILMDVVRTEACRSAIKFGDALTKDACRGLLKQLSQCKLPFQCAHGRPSVAVLHTIAEMNTEKKEIKLNLKKLLKPK